MEILAIDKSFKKKEYFNYFKKNNFSHEDKTITSNSSIDDIISKNNDNDLKSFEIIDNNFDFFLNFFQKKLNHIHNENNNKIYWHKIIGEWLHDFIEESFYHWTKIENFSEKYEILGCKNFTFEDFIPEDTKDFHKLRVSSVSWKNWFIKACLKFKIGKKLELYPIKKKEKTKKNFFLQTQKYLFIERNDLFLYKLDLPKKKTLSIFLKYNFLQIPFKKEKIYINENTNFEIRKEFSNFRSEEKFKNFILNLVPYCVPKNFVENYKIFKQVALNLKWPKSPKYILSSYPYFDDIFKFYYSNLDSTKTKMIILQHGSETLKIDFKLGRKRLPVFAKTSWSFNKDNKNEYESTFTKSSQPINKKKFIIKNNNRNLIILYNFNENYCTPYGLKYDQYIRNEAILYNTKLIYSQMDEKIKKKTDLKILNLNERNFLKQKLMVDYPNIQIVDEKFTLRNIINNYNFFIHFHISTPFYECMYFNKPSILIIDRRILFWQLKPSIEEFFKKYKNIIFFYNCDEATKFIKNIDLEKWWNSKSVQVMRKEFCDQFCNDSSEFMSKLNRIII